MNSTFRKVLALSAAVGVALDTACYAYVPAIAGTPPPRPGMDVRVELTSDGTAELAQYLGPRVVLVDGRLASIASGGAMGIAPTSVKVASGVRQQWGGEEIVSFPEQYVSGLELRTLDKRKTTIAAAAIIASLAAAGAIFMRGGGSNTPTGTAPGDGVFIRKPF